MSASATDSDGFTRRVELSAAYDNRSPDPSKNYGIHGVDLRFVLIGPKGAVHLLIYTGWQLPHVEEEHRRKGYDNRPMGADLGYHSPTPRYEEQTPNREVCEYIGCACYGDGSGLQADEGFRALREGGDEAVWKLLRGRYDSWLGDG